MDAQTFLIILFAVIVVLGILGAALRQPKTYTDSRAQAKRNAYLNNRKF